MEDYFEAKRRLFLEGRPPAAINIGDPWGRRLAEDRPDALTYGFAEDAEIRPGRAGGHRPQAQRPLQRRERARRDAPARLLGIDDDTIARGLEALDGVPGRFEAVDEGQPFTVLVDYAHTPDSLENVLATARELDAGRVICVFGCGGDRDREKAPADGPHRGATWPTSRSSPPTTPAARTRARSSTSPRGRGRRARGRARSSRGDRPRDRGRRARRRRGHRGQGPRAGAAVPATNVPFDDREVAREALEAARGADTVIPFLTRRCRSLPRQARRRAVGGRGDRRSDRLAAHRGRATSSLQSVGRARDFIRPRLCARGRCDAHPEDTFAELGALGAAVRARSSGSRRRHHRFDRQDLDEGHPGGALPPGHPPAHRSPPRRATTTRSGCPLTH